MRTYGTKRKSGTVGDSLSRGFTLIELLLVLVILSVLAGLVVPRFAKRSEQAKVTAANTDISNIGTSLRTFELDCGRYPNSNEGLRALVEDPGNLPGWKRTLDRGVPNDPWGNAYIYRCPGQHEGVDYDLFSCGPDGQEGTEDDIANWATK